VRDPLNVDNEYFTGAGGFLQVCGLTEGDYTVREATPEGFANVGLNVNGVDQTPQPVYAFFWSPGKPEPVIVFRNQVGAEDPQEPWD
jgi:hypothetical protein